MEISLLLNFMVTVIKIPSSIREFDFEHYVESTNELYYYSSCELWTQFTTSHSMQGQLQTNILFILAPTAPEANSHEQTKIIDTML